MVVDDNEEGSRDEKHSESGGGPLVGYGNEGVGMGSTFRSSYYYSVALERL